MIFLWNADNSQDFDISLRQPQDLVGSTTSEQCIRLSWDPDVDMHLGNKWKLHTKEHRRIEKCGGGKKTEQLEEIPVGGWREHGWLVPAVRLILSPILWRNLIHYIPETIEHASVGVQRKKNGSTATFMSSVFKNLCTWRENLQSRWVLRGNR